MRLKTCFQILLGFFFLSGLILASWLLYIQSSLPDVDSLKEVHLQVPLRIYSQDGVLIGEFGEKRREPVDLAEVPHRLIEAFLATEDARYYHHKGVDMIGIFRAALHLIRSGTKGQGGSTITMQVARNFFLNPEKTYLRKVREILLALKIERELSKDEILNLYLNKIYLGNRAYGVGAAAQIYYGKKLVDLTLDEMAMLAGLPKAPSAVNPIVNPIAAVDRRQHVLSRMKLFGYITEAEYEAAQQVPVHARYHGLASELDAPYVAEMVRNAMVSRFGEDIYVQGYRVYTTVDARLQKHANTVVQEHLVAFQKSSHQPEGTPSAQAALVALDPNNGAILALVGGTDYAKSKFNRAVQAKRQPGSNFKPFVYSAALERGFTPASIINDAPLVFQTAGQKEPWRPQNDNHRFYGPTRLRVALSKSRNLVSIRLLQSIGVPYAVSYVKRFGFEEEALPANLTMVLGTGVVTPLSMARGYATFANGGYLIAPYIIARVEDSAHHVLLDATPMVACSECEQRAAPQVISPQNAYVMTQMLQDAIRTGTGRLALSLGRSDLAGKTGTTNEHMDAWYSGFNSSLVVTTWMGYDTLRPLKKYASQTTLPLWVDFMKEALKGVPDSPLPEPPGLITVKIDPRSGALAESDQQNGIYETFYEHNTPKATTADLAEGDEDPIESLF